MPFITPPPQSPPPTSNSKSEFGSQRCLGVTKTQLQIMFLSLRCFNKTIELNPIT